MRRCNNSPIVGSRGFFWLCLATFTLIFQIAVGTASAQIYTLTSGNSSASINLGSQAGMYNWSVDGQNQLNQQWFWYRVGSSGPEASIDTIGMPTVQAYGTSILDTTYTSSKFSLSVDYTLTGGAPGSGVSDLSETIVIQNLTSSALPLYFFQYADFNLGGTPNNDSGNLDKTSKGFNQVNQYDGVCHLGENVDTVVSHPATYAEVANDNSILNSLNNSTPTTLNDNMSTTGNVKWALEWVPSGGIAPGGTYIISKDLNISGVVAPVPEPSTWSLILLGLLAGGMWRFRSAGRAS
ncbi:MAG: PEP-CTERM sorting domain-containing protein [Verrucomicrobiia bacterium]